MSLRFPVRRGILKPIIKSRKTVPAWKYPEKVWEVYISTIPVGILFKALEQWDVDNPGMVKDTTTLLKSRGFKIHQRRSPGQITYEK